MCLLVHVWTLVQAAKLKLSWATWEGVGLIHIADCAVQKGAHQLPCKVSHQRFHMIGEDAAASSSSYLVLLLQPQMPGWKSSPPAVLFDGLLRSCLRADKVNMNHKSECQKV